MSKSLSQIPGSSPTVRSCLNAFRQRPFGIADERRFLKEDTEHDLEMEKLISGRVRAAQLQIDQLERE
jgi:hypothetical protein